MVTDKLTLGFLIVVCIAQGNAQTEIKSTSTSVDLNVGDTAMFECQVMNLQVNQKVVWTFVDHNVTISSGDDIHAGNGFEEKYSIYRPQDQGGSNYWNLAINDVQSHDAGSYKCEVTGTNAKVIHHLNVLGLPPKIPAQHYDVTGCCVKKGVENCALPLCSTNTTLDVVLQVVTNDACMEKNLVSVLQCAQDGRNHLGCCIRGGLSDTCQHLCDARIRNDGTVYTSCIGTPTITLIECLKEGQFNLPSQPTGVSAVNLGEKILVSWRPPEENVDLVSGYKVQYRVKGDDTFNSTPVLSKTSYTEVLKGLTLDIVYEINVIALASTGSSQPSYTVDIATGVVHSADYRNGLVSDCCKQKNVSQECQQYCTPGNFFMGGDTDSYYNCHSQLDKMYHCLAGYGNHTPCCERVQVPEPCYSLCEGSVDVSWDIAFCYVHMQLISACIVEGSAVLPDPPKSTHIEDGSVTSTSAVVVWEKPDNWKTGEQFVVSWKLEHSDLPQWTSVNVVSGTRFQITNLQPATMYNVIVSTINDKGSSLPELTLVLVTEGMMGDVQTPFNETVCCMEKGVESQCLDLCTHRFRLTDDVLTLGLQCSSAISPMLICATDGRDHTGCCRREGIPDHCLGLCNLTHDSSPSIEFLTCFTYKNELSTCFNEGKQVLPRMPKEIAVKAFDVYSITIDWMRPGGPNITSFRVEYSMDNTFWTFWKSVTQTFAEVTGLKPDTTYYLRVLSENDNGRSLPSAVVKAYTLPVPVNGTQERNWLMLWNSKADCCAKSSNVTICKNACTSGGELDLLQCAGDIDRIIACGADGRDHTECCSKYPKFPDSCLQYCMGQPGTRDAQSALCLQFIEPMFTCFTEGKGVIPSQPMSLKADATSSTKIMMKWQVPTENCDSGCEYTALLWTDDSFQLKNKTRTNDTRISFVGLDPETQYRVSVTASNKYGSSLPSPYVILSTPPDSPGTVAVSQSPPGVIDAGESVQLECAGHGMELDTVKWVRNKVTVKYDNLYYIKTVSKSSKGLYTCSVTFADNSSRSKDLYLNVRHLPEPVSMSDNSVLPGVRLDVDIICVFSGYPDIVTWTKDGHALQGGNKYLIQSLVNNNVTGRTSSTLRIKNVVSSDFGSYVCTGENKFGQNSITGSLKNNFPGTDFPPADRPEPGHVNECCLNKGVPKECATPICTYAIDINAVITDPSLFYCLDYLEEFFACGSDGKNHSKCCIEGGVMEFCLPFCSGKVPAHEDKMELLMCMTHAEILLNCAVNAINYVPSAPNNVRAQLYYDTVKVFWDYGGNADRVDVYHVWYESQRQTKSYDGVVRSAKSYQLPSDFVKRGDKITIWIVAQNDFGSSQPSEKYSLDITSLVPKMPRNVQAEPIDATSVDVKWDPPTTPLKIIKYTVSYKIIDGASYTLSTVSTSTRLTGLKPNTRYGIRVAAVSVDGSGQISSYIYIRTKSSSGEGGTGSKQEGGQSTETAGIAVGVVLGILFLVAIIVVAVLLFRRLRVPRSPTQNSTVAFENPQYSASQRVTGLPGETDDSNQFGYGKLKEERDNQHDYVTLENQQISPTDNSGTPATLNIQQA